jgi:hypothetical protein
MLMEYFNYKYITGAATTTIAARPAFLHAIVLNEVTAGAITILDGADTIAIIKAATAAQTLTYDICLKTSLIVTTAQGDDITVSYKPLQS